MSKIIATDNFKTNNWQVSFEDLDSSYADLFIGFTDEAPVAEFKDLQFKYELRQGENIKQYGVFPPPNTRYIRSDQPYLVVERLNLRPEIEYDLYLWAMNNKQEFEKTVTFTTPKPPQPYPSWIWDGETWNPPISYPTDGNFYVWDEETISWSIDENDK